MIEGHTLASCNGLTPSVGFSLVSVILICHSSPQAEHHLRYPFLPNKATFFIPSHALN